jgi:hypothetical protein
MSTAPLFETTENRKQPGGLSQSILMHSFHGILCSRGRAQERILCYPKHLKSYKDGAIINTVFKKQITGWNVSIILFGVLLEK